MGGISPLIPAMKSITGHVNLSFPGEGEDRVSEDNDKARNSLCPDCGAEAVTGSAFCSSCGHSLAQSTTPSPAADVGARALDPGVTEPVTGHLSTSTRRNKIAIITIVAALIIAGGTALLVRTKSSPNHPQAATSGQAAPPTSTKVAQQRGLKTILATFAPY